MSTLLLVQSKFSQLSIRDLNNRYDEDMNIELVSSVLFVGILGLTFLLVGLLCWAIWAVFIRMTFYRIIGSHVLVPLPPNIAIEALMKRMVEEGYQAKISKSYVTTFRSRQPDHGLCGLLVLVGLIPGLLYYMLASVGTLSSIAAVESVPTGETLVSIYGVDFKAYKIAWEWGRDTREAHKKAALQDSKGLSLAPLEVPR